ncbi:MAG: hypothetical protein JWL92_395 [Candidatus Nomurabacteria bacterium]|nr:hypothetical protein [Candidatus Nomurabacteria bacterium]
MENNYKNTVEEHEDVTVIPLDPTKQQLENLERKHVAALESNDDIEAKRLEEEINTLNEELGLDETKEAA